LIVPFSIGTGSESSINAVMILLVALIGLWFLTLITQKKLAPFRPLRLEIAILVFMGLAIFSFAFGQLPWFYAQHAPIRAQIGGLAIFILCGGAFLLMDYRLKSIRILEWITYLFLVLGAVYIAGSVIPRVSQVVERFYSSGASGSLFWTWLVAIAFSQALINKKLSLPARIAIFILVVITIFSAFVLDQGWTSGWLPPLIALGVILFVYAPSRWRIPLIILAVALAFIQKNTIYNALLAGDNQYSLTTRLAAWTILFRIIGANPLFGVGPANYYWYTPLFPIMGYSVVFNSHNNLVDILAETGIIGLAGFFWFFAEVGLYIWRLRSKVPEGFARAYMIGAFGGLIGTLIATMFGDWVIPFVYNIGFKGFRASVLGWIFIGGAIALGKIIQQDKAKDAFESRINGG